ncbi:LEU7 protein, partial [Rhipidura dahli]|nr:LEU7 protein [Rhipidura dahli]
MAGSGALLLSVRYQAGALLILWAAAAPQLPHSRHTQTSSTSRSGPARHRPGEEGEISKHGGAQRLEGERRALGKSPKDGEECGDLSLSPSEPRPGRLAQPRLERCEALQETALCSKKSLLVAETSHLLHVEHLLLPLLQQHPLPLHPTLIRNICSHMALQREGQQFEKDLHEAHQCLKTIIEKLICSLAVFPSDSYIPVRSALRQILQNPLA